MTERPPPALSRSRSRQIASTAVDALSDQRDKLLDQGLSTISFAVGVGNMLLTAFTIGRFPQHYWVLHALKGLLYFPLRSVRFAQQQALLNLGELCWVVNALIICFLLVAAADELTSGSLLAPATLRAGFLLLFMFGAGPLGWSVGFLGNAIIFHSLDHLASLFIHAGPFLTCWSLLGADPAVVGRWYPQLGGMLANLRADPPDTSELLIPAATLYVLWWVPYTAVHVALLPAAKDYFEAQFRAVLGNGLSRRAAACFHSLAHLLLSALALLIAALAFYRVYALFTCFCVAMCALALWNGASRYNYYMVEAYRKKLEQAIEKSLDRGEHTGKAPEGGEGPSKAPEGGEGPSKSLH